MRTIPYDSEEAKRLCNAAWREDQECCVSGCEDKATKLGVDGRNHRVYPLCERGFHYSQKKTGAVVLEDKPRPPLFTLRNPPRD